MNKISELSTTSGSVAHGRLSGGEQSSTDCCHTLFLLSFIDVTFSVIFFYWYWLLVCDMQLYEETGNSNQ